MFGIFTKYFQIVQELCDDQDSQDMPEMPKRDLSLIRSFTPLRFGASKDQLKEEFLLEASYSKDFAKVKREREKDRRGQSQRGNMRVYGYKYPKALKFLATAYKCLKDCYDKRYEALNVDMNYFLLLKNELSLSFLRKFDNVVATVRSAIKLYASKDESNRREIENAEISALDKIIISQIKAGSHPVDAQIADLGAR